ncbi:MAG: hypothetical protein KDA80_07135 [Planctomycetaceae bacterium]|nr:hypothetical protein [Planctomycetaceae bacterium]
MIPVFAMRLICGLSLAWCLIPRREITSGFFRIQNLLCLGLAVLTALSAGQFDNLQGSRILFFGGILSSVVAFLGSIFWTLERRTGGFRLATGLCLLATAAVVGVATVGNVNTQIPAWMRNVDALTAAGLMGSTTAAMLLGHWYLTATGMPLRPLVQYSMLAGAAIILRGLYALGHWSAGGFAESASWPLMALRWAGLVGPLIMVWLTIRILRYRNTQSATGVLYAATILVFMGEMAAALLARSGASGA